MRLDPFYAAVIGSVAVILLLLAWVGFDAPGSGFAAAALAVVFIGVTAWLALSSSRRRR